MPRLALKRLRRGAASAVVGVSLVLVPASNGAVTIGQVDPSASPDAGCFANLELLQPSVVSGPNYVVPGQGTITSWSHKARSNDGQLFSLRVFRKVADPVTYQLVAQDGPRTLAPLSLNTFPVQIAVRPGDLIGANSGGGLLTACFYDAPGEAYLSTSPPIAAVGQNADFTGGGFDQRINIAARFEPDNTFTRQGITYNRRKGTAAITILVPNAGNLRISGKGVKAAQKAVAATGQTTLPIKAKGKKQRKLRQSGKVKLTPRITYTPTGGAPRTQSQKLKLRRKTG